MKKKLINLRKEILSVSYQANAGHIPSAFSILEIIYVLYKNILKQEDKFLLSKGHGCLALYAIFYEMGFISKEQFYSFSRYDSLLGGHPDRNKLKEIQVSAGSLGHGLPISIGMCLSKKINNESGKIFCLVGDGECNEGTTWESLLLAEKLNLKNLICIIDNNNSQTRSVPTTNIESKFKSFGFHTINCNGHDIEKLIETLNTEVDKPLAIICNTIKGYGIYEMENDMFSWHHGAPSKEKFELFIKELENK